MAIQTDNPNIVNVLQALDANRDEARQIVTKYPSALFTKLTLLASMHIFIGG